MFRPIQQALLVLAALAPIGCATNGELSGSATDVYNDAAGVALTPPPGTAHATAIAASTAISSATEPAEHAGVSGTTTESAASAADVAALQSQAEDAYRARRFDEALALYERVVELQPANAHAWLRVGNVHHQRRDWFKAITAYRRASARTLAGVETEPAVRAKAYYNVALIDLELARQSLRSLERLGGASEPVGDPAPLAREIERTQRRLEAILSREPSAQPSASADAGADGLARRTDSRTGDTPAKSDRPTKLDPRGRSDKPTKIDYIRGEPRP